MNITCAFFGTLFIIVGILFSLGKLHVYLNVWKKCRRKKKKKYGSTDCAITLAV